MSEQGTVTTPPEIPGWRHIYSGKVRELYVPDESRLRATGVAIYDDAEYRAGSVLVLATDRISAFDEILPTEIPDKGKILTQLSLWWFEQLAAVPNHVLSTDVHESVRGRAVVCKNLSMFPVECIARGYLTGSGLKDYRETGEVCGIELPPGLVDGSRLAEPIFTPTGKTQVVRGKDLSAVRWVVGTGGALTRVPGGADILRRICTGAGAQLLPSPEATIVIDRDYRFSALGTVAQCYPDEVRRTFAAWIESLTGNTKLPSDEGVGVNDDAAPPDVTKNDTPHGLESTS